MRADSLQLSEQQDWASDAWLAIWTIVWMEKNRVKHNDVALKCLKDVHCRLKRTGIERLFRDALDGKESEGRRRMWEQIAGATSLPSSVGRTNRPFKASELLGVWSRLPVCFSFLSGKQEDAKSNSEVLSIINRVHGSLVKREMGRTKIRYPRKNAYRKLKLEAYSEFRKHLFAKLNTKEEARPVGGCPLDRPLAQSWPSLKIYKSLLSSLDVSDLRQFEADFHVENESDYLSAQKVFVCHIANVLTTLQKNAQPENIIQTMSECCQWSLATCTVAVVLIDRGQLESESLGQLVDELDSKSGVEQVGLLVTIQSLADDGKKDTQSISDEALSSVKRHCSAELKEISRLGKLGDQSLVLSDVPIERCILQVTGNGDLCFQNAEIVEHEEELHLSVDAIVPEYLNTLVKQRKLLSELSNQHPSLKSILPNTLRTELWPRREKIQKFFKSMSPEAIGELFKNLNAEQLEVFKTLAADCRAKLPFVVQTPERFRCWKKSLQRDHQAGLSLLLDSVDKLFELSPRQMLEEVVEDANSDFTVESWRERIVKYQLFFSFFDDHRLELVPGPAEATAVSRSLEVVKFEPVDRPEDQGWIKVGGLLDGEVVVTPVFGKYMHPKLSSLSSLVRTIRNQAVDIPTKRTCDEVLKSLEQLEKTNDVVSVYQEVVKKMAHNLNFADIYAQADLRETVQEFWESFEAVVEADGLSLIGQYGDEVSEDEIDRTLHNLITVGGRLTEYDSSVIISPGLIVAGQVKPIVRANVRDQTNH